MKNRWKWNFVMNCNDRGRGTSGGGRSIYWSRESCGEGESLNGHGVSMGVEGG
jgi:hypothetical protein